MYTYTRQGYLLGCTCQMSILDTLLAAGLQALSDLVKVLRLRAAELVPGGMFQVRVGSRGHARPGIGPMQA